METPEFVCTLKSSFKFLWTVCVELLVSDVILLLLSENRKSNLYITKFLKKCCLNK